MAKYRWPTDPPGKPPRHSIPYSQYQARPGTPASNAQGFINTYNKGNPQAPYGSEAFWKDYATKGSLGQNKPTEGGPPVDPALEAQKASAALGIRLGDAYDTYQTGQINRDFGFNAAGGIDPGNPYSQASLLQDSYRNQQRGTQNNLAATGQLYSGALGNAQAYNTRQFDVGVDRLKKAQASALNDILRGKIDRYTQTGAAIDQGQLDSILHALGAK